ncbi:MAG: hypothetical protein B6D61_02495 [Bacteroidetes bacterium 4484_249]|nr:MAG: hypothetical protein B6D61_02495 [Bacteroidetes bacterium 4484_249]
MKKIMILTLITGFAFAILTSFTNTKTTSDNLQISADNQQFNSEMFVFAGPSGLPGQMELGEKIYKEKCTACHQADANGIKGAFPPLKDSDYLQADLKRAVAQVLNGSNIEMVVNGETYKMPMTPQVETKEDAVAVINYVLKTFNGYSEDKFVKLEDVKDVVIKPKL